MVQLLVDHRRVICSLAFVLKLWLDRVDARRKSFQVYVNLLLQQLSSVTSTAHSRSASLAWVRLRSVLSRESVPAFPRTWAKPVRTHSAWRLQVVDVSGVCKSWMSSHLPLTLGPMTSARIASSCFTRPRFDLELSSTAPQIPAKRVRLSCSLKPRVFSSTHHDVLNVGLSTPHVVVTLCTSGHHA